jgi:hypothetical protein
MEDPASGQISQVIVLGAGRFGRIALERLHRRHPLAELHVIESSAERLARIPDVTRLITTWGDAVRYLCDHDAPPDTWIVPAVPVHVAFEWLLVRLNRNGRRTKRIGVPVQADSQVPNPYRPPDDTLYTSYAAFRCPDNCAEADVCAVTGEPRPGDLYRTLETLSVAGFRSLVLQSHQLAPGVGGYTMGALRQLQEAVASSSTRYLLATACCCHGVINAFECSWKVSRKNSRTST